MYSVSPHGRLNISRNFGLRGCLPGHCFCMEVAATCTLVSGHLSGSGDFLVLQYMCMHTYVCMCLSVATLTAKFVC